MDNTVPQSQQRPVQQPAPPAVPTTDDKPKLPVHNPVGAPNKEFGPVASVSPSEQGAQPEAGDDEDEIKVARQEVLTGQKVSPVKEVPLSPELKEIGVEQGIDTPKEIPIVVQRAGMRSTDVATGVPASAIPTVKLPISYAHAAQLDKRSKIKESIKWLARAIKRQWERLTFLEKHKGDNLEEL